MKNVKVIFILGGAALGGAERQALLLAKGLRERKENFDIQFICIGNKKGRATDILEKNDFIYYLIPYNQKSVFKHVSLLCKILIIIKRLKPNILMPFSDLVNICVALIRPFIKIDVCLWNQRNQQLQGNVLFEKLMQLIMQSRVKYFNRFISNSQGGADYLEQTLKIPCNKISVIYNGVVIENPIMARNEWRTEHGFSENVFLACMVANLTIVKDHPTLIKAWAEVCKKNKKDKCLLLAGWDGSRKNYLSRLAKELQVEDSVVFLGEVADVNSLLHAVDLCVFSSVSEGTPNGVLESMAAGLPVIASDIPNIRYAMGTENQNFLFPCGDYIDLAGKIVQMFSFGSEQRKAIGAANKRRIEDYFNVDSMVNSFIKEMQ